MLNTLPKHLFLTSLYAITKLGKENGIATIEHWSKKDICISRNSGIIRQAFLFSSNSSVTYKKLTLSFTYSIKWIYDMDSKYDWEQSLKSLCQSLSEFYIWYNWEQSYFTEDYQEITPGKVTYHIHRLFILEKYFQMIYQIYLFNFKMQHTICQNVEWLNGRMVFEMANEGMTS